ncbi:hypothetical protein ACFLWW_02490 [Chloroflexota bacterium]
MRLFHHHQPGGFLYLMPVRQGNEQLPKDKVRMLSCDAEGKVHTLLLKKSIYELAKRHAKRMEYSHKNYATLGFEINHSKPATLAVEVEAEQFWALEHILEHALKKGRLPDILKKYPKQIIKLGESRRKELTAQNERQTHSQLQSETPSVLYRLPYYSEDNVEVSIPIYKAEHRYPLIVLKQLPPNEHIPPDMQRLLVLDSEGDLAIIKVPLGIMDRVKKDFDKWKKANNQDGCIIYSRHPKGFSTNYMAINELQREALNKIAKHFEETGHGEQPVSTTARAVLVRARDTASSMP